MASFSMNMCDSTITILTIIDILNVALKVEDVYRLAVTISIKFAYLSECTRRLTEIGSHL